MKKWIFSGLLVLLVVGVVEMISFAGLHLLERRQPGTVVELFLAEIFREQVTPAEIRKFGQGKYDRELGWVNKPNMRSWTSKNRAGVEWSVSTDHRGARDGPGNEGSLRISTYGDSFTRCSGVSNDETWQTYLAANLQGAVLNFGVSAYSTLQAILRMERHFAKGLVAPVTVLAIRRAARTASDLVLQNATLSMPVNSATNLATRPADSTCGPIANPDSI